MNIQDKLSPPLAQKRNPRLLRRRMVLVVGATAIGLAAVLLTPSALLLLGGGYPAFPPAVVSTTVAGFDAWQPRIDVVGSVRPVNGADLATEVSGIVEEVYTSADQDVAAGTPLVRLRATDDQARLQTLESAAELAAANFTRDERQFAINAIAKQALDTSAATLRSARAQVNEQRAVIEKKVVRAPFAGRVGVRQVNVGQYVNPGTVVMTLQSLDPVYFDFSVPQQALDNVRAGQKLSITVDAYPGETFEGEITAVDPKVDPSTRNISVRATLPNPENKLLPGMFAKATIVTGAQERHITLPQTAISFNPYGNTVYLVKEQTGEDGAKTLVAEQTFVTTGATRGDQVAVLSGVSEGDVVISGGQVRVQNGAAITVNNDVQPTNDPNPAPVER